ncbi:hypothetical protein IC575_002561 [Cucumis melo]
MVAFSGSDFGVVWIICSAWFRYTMYSTKFPIGAASGFWSHSISLTCTVVDIGL